MLLSQEKNCLSLQYNPNNSFLNANDANVYQFKAKYYEAKPYQSCSGNFSEEFAVNNREKNKYLVRSSNIIITF